MTTARAQQAADPDPWLGRDKILHGTVSAVLAGGTYAVAATQFDRRWPPLVLGAGVALGAGVGKELADLAGLGTPSWRDFTWDLLGTAVGLGLAWSIDLLVRGVSQERPVASSSGLQLSW